MKRLICVALAAIAPLCAIADEKVKACTEMAEVAGLIAKAHQDGTSLDAMLGLKGFESLHPLMIEIYSANTRYSSEVMQSKQVTDTKNAAMLACMKAD